MNGETDERYEGEETGVWQEKRKFTFGRCLSRLALWLGFAIIVLLAVPAGIVIALISGIRSFVDWVICRLERKGSA